MAESLASKYRPKTFEDVCAQKPIIQILKTQLKNRDFKNALLFCGSSGCGKTTCARIFANEINQGFGEPIEIDAASNNGVENIRTITKSANERALDGEYKIYIIDETHALTAQSWQAFLKCLEEPPKYTIFIFCTTDPQKIPETILNRVMRFNFTRIPIEQIKDRLKYICEQEHFSAQEDAIDYIARISDGGMRTAISLLDKVASYDNNITIDNTLNALGNFSYAVFLKLLLAVLKKDEQQVLKIISEYYDAGNDMKLLVNQFLMFCLDVDKYLIFKSCDMTKIPATMESSLQQISAIENAPKIIASYLDVLLNLKNLIKNDVSPKGSIEVTFLRMARMIK